MAPAVLATVDEPTLQGGQQCGVVFMKKFTNTNPNPNFANYTTFKIDAYDSTQLHELKNRFKSELDQIRILRERIESLDGPKKKKPKKSGSRPDPETEKLLKSCGSILIKLMKHKFAWVFNTPVDVAGLGLHDYHLIVKKPMDLGTVKSNLEKGYYCNNPVDFATDVRLTFSNAMAYNPKGQDVYFMADKLLDMFNGMFKKFEAQIVSSSSRQWSPLPVPEPVNVRKGTEQISIAKKMDTVPTLPPPRVQSPVAEPKPPSPVPEPVVEAEAGSVRKGKLPKPKAKDPNKRLMSMEEKAKLGMNLQDLPPEKLGQLVQILRKRNGHLAQDGDEIELDIEAVDNETLWELDRFVTNYKKMASKIKRQGFITNVSTPPRNITSMTEMGSAEKRRKGDAGEEDIDIGEDIPIEDYPSVEIERDGTAVVAAASSGGSSSSGSSSSSSGSSSSGSGGSSSGSDSDADSVQSPFVEAKEGQ